MSGQERRWVPRPSKAVGGCAEFRDDHVDFGDGFGEEGGAGAGAYEEELRGSMILSYKVGWSITFWKRSVLARIRIIVMVYLL